MKNEIYVLIDYLGRFETKVPSIPYRSGFNKNLLEKEFNNLGFQVIFLNYSEIDFSKDNFKDKFVIYTSIEDSGLFYKDFIEDILWGIKLQGGILIPRIELFRAHHNKVFMEILRSGFDHSIHTRYYGSFQELLRDIDKFKYPVVVKSASGSGSKGVRLAKNKCQLLRYSKKLSNSGEWKNFFKEKGLLIKRLYQTKKLFKTESKYRKKFIIQNFIPNLKNDWKVLIYGNKIYVLERSVRKNDFRASGSGNFISINNTNKNLPKEFFNYIINIYNKLDCPNISLDIAYSNGEFYLLEFQAVSFGTITQTISNSYFIFKNNRINLINKKLPLEKVYAESIINYIQTKYVKK